MVISVFQCLAAGWLVCPCTSHSCSWLVLSPVSSVSWLVIVLVVPCPSGAQATSATQVALFAPNLFTHHCIQLSLLSSPPLP